MRDCKSLTDILSKIRSSEYKKLLKHLLFIKQPCEVFSSSDKTTSIYAEKRSGDKIPPCLTPDNKQTGFDKYRST